MFKINAARILHMKHSAIENVMDPNPHPYYSTHSDPQMGYYTYDQPAQEVYNAPNSNEIENIKPKKTSIYKPNLNTNLKKPKPVAIKTFYVTPKKPPTPQYIPLSQTLPEDLKQQDTNKSRFRAFGVDSLLSNLLHCKNGHEMHS